MKLNFTAWWTAMYEIATRLLPRVRLKNNPGVAGLVLSSDADSNSLLVHWGWDTGKAVETWTDVQDVFPDVSKELSNGKG